MSSKAVERAIKDVLDIVAGKETNECIENVLAVLEDQCGKPLTLVSTTDVLIPIYVEE